MNVSHPRSRPITNRRARAMLVEVAKFLLVFAALQLEWQAVHGSAFERVVIEDGVVRPAAYVANLLTPAIDVRAEGAALRAPGGGVNILNGCEGVEAVFLLVAAFMVAHLPWHSRVLGILCGVGMVFLVNEVRVLILFYAYRADHTLFDRLHSTVTPISVVLLVATYFYSWISRAHSIDQRSS